MEDYQKYLPHKGIEMNWQNRIYENLVEGREAATMGQLFAPEEKAEEKAKETRMAEFIRRFGKGTTVKPVKRPERTLPGWAVRTSKSRS